MMIAIPVSASRNADRTTVTEVNDSISAIFERILITSLVTRYSSRSLRKKMPATMKIRRRNTSNPRTSSWYTLAGLVIPIATASIASSPPGCNG